MSRNRVLKSVALLAVGSVLLGLLPAGAVRAAGGAGPPGVAPGGRLTSVLFLQQEQLGRHGLHRGLSGLTDARWIETAVTKDAWENAGQRFKVRFRKTAGPELGRLELPSRQAARLELVGARPVPGRVEGESVVYRNILPQVDLLFTLADDGFKESLVIRKLLGEPVYRFRLDLAGVTPEVKGGEVFFRDASTGRPVFYLPAPFMTDATGAISTDVAVSVEPDGAGYLLTLRPSRAWLSDRARAYPVSIDPSLALWPGQLGLEPYWAYYDLPLDDRGSVSVNPFNGNLVLKYLDTYQASQGPATFIERTYNSQDNTNGILGFNWVHNYFGFLLENADGSVTFTDTDGTRAVFSLNAGGTYDAPPGIHKNLTRHVDASGLVTFTLEGVPSHLIETYDAGGNLVARADNSGNTTTLSYSDGALATVTDASGGVTRFDTTNADGGVVGVTDPAGRAFAYARDDYGNLISVTDPTGAAVSMTYDAPAHRLTALTDATGRRTSLGYDADGRVSAVTLADGSVWSFAYDPLSSTASVTTPEGQIWIYAFNDSANLTLTTGPDGQATAYEWDADLNLSSATSPSGGVTSFTYNNWGEKLTQTDPNGMVTTFEYDAGGNLIRTVDPEQASLAVAYDSRDNPTSFTDSSGGTVTLAYDSQGNNSAFTDGNGQATSYGYDESGNLTQTVDPLGGEAIYTYDTSCRLTSAEITRDGVTYFRAGYAYDELDRLLSVTDALDNTTHQTYDGNGNLTEVLRPGGRRVGYAYGPANALQGVSHDGTTISAFDYDAGGNLVTMTVAGLANPFTYAYDGQNRLAAATDPWGAQIGYARDVDGRVTSTTVTASSVAYGVGYAYDAKGRLAGLTGPDGGTIAYAYGANDRLTSETLPNGLVKQVFYDAANKVTEVRHTDAAGNVLWDESYTYDPAGNRTEVRGLGGEPTSYEYDALNRLVTETDPVTAEKTVYAYDPAGNRTSKTVYDSLGGLLSQTTYTYNQADELVAIDGVPQVYDLSGNLISDGQRTFAWDAENRLAEVREAATGASVASFTYDGAGRRLSQTTVSGTTFYHYDGDKVAFETDEAGNVTLSYTYGPAGLPATLTYQGQTYYYHTNDRGDVLGLTDAAGNVKARYRYDAWGSAVNSSGTIAEVNPCGYAGYRLDRATGLFYLVARYYDATLGRFLGRDVDPGGVKEGGSLNWYVYAGNNPASFIDPDGRDKLDVALGVAGLVLRTAALFVAAATPVGWIIGVATVVICIASGVKSVFDYSNGKISGGDLAMNIGMNALGVAAIGVGGLSGQVVNVLSGPYVACSAGMGYLDTVGATRRKGGTKR